MPLEWQKTFFLHVIKATYLGLLVEFRKKKCIITNNRKKVVGFGIKDFFSIGCNVKPSWERQKNAHLVVSKQLTSVQWWHDCLGQLGPKNVKLLSKKNLVENNIDKQEELTFVKVVMCKANNVWKVSQKKEHCAQINYSGLSTLMSKTPSLSKARYFVFFTNDFS